MPLHQLLDMESFSFLHGSFNLQELVPLQLPLEVTAVENTFTATVSRPSKLSLGCHGSSSQSCWSLSWPLAAQLSDQERVSRENSLKLKRMVFT